MCVCVRVSACVQTGVCCLYAINLLACGVVVVGGGGWTNGCVDGRADGSRTTVLHGDGGRLPHLLVESPISPDPSGNLIVNKAEIQTNNTGSSSMGGRDDLEWCGIPAVDVQGNS